MRIRLWGRVFLLSKKKCAFFLLLILVICTFIGYGLVSGNPFFKSTHNDNKPRETILFVPKATLCPTPTEISPTNTTYAIHLTGCITNPGVVYVPSGGILYDAILLAGGFTQEADTEVANLAMKLTNGMQIRIPSKNDTNKTWLISYGVGNNQSDYAHKEHASDTKNTVNINTASISQLMTLSGIGESTAKAIISYREEQGPFSSIEDIMNVPGIKEGKYNKIKDDISISS